MARTNQVWQGYHGAYIIQRKRAVLVGLGYGVSSEFKIKGAL